MSVVDRLAGLNVDSPEKELISSSLATLQNDGSNLPAAKALFGAYIHLEAYASALKHLSVVDGAIRPQLASELAYIYYRADKLAELRDLAKSHPDSPAVVLSLAQAEYKAGNYADALRLLEHVKVSGDEIYDRDVNVSAIRAHVEKSAGSVFGEGFEHSFNSSYAALLAGDYRGALATLKEAKQLARDDEESYDAVVQAAYAHAQLGETDEARALLSSFEDAELSSLLQLVVKNNLLALGETTTPEAAFLALRALDMHAGQAGGLIAKQAEILEANKIVLQGIAGRKVGRVAASYGKAHTTRVVPQVVATLAASEGGNLSALRKLVAREPTNIAAALLTAQKLHVERPQEAATTVINLVNALVAAQQPVGAALVGAAVAAYKLRSGATGSGAAVTQLLESVELDSSDFALPALYLAQSHSVEDRRKAEKFFKGLHDKGLAAAGLCATIPEDIDYPRLSQSLPSIEELTAGIDAAALERDGMLGLLKRKARPGVSGAVGGVYKRSKRSGKAKLPKDYDAARTPDPERWLAKQDRSTYKPKKKKGSKGGASQGSSQGATQGAIEDSAVPARPSSVLTSSGSAAANKSKAKKKKGGKKK